MVLVRDVRTAPATQNPGGGTLTRLGVVAGVCSNHRFRHSPPFQPRLPARTPPPQSLWFPQGRHLTGCDSSQGHPLRPIQCGTCGSGFSSSLQCRWLPSRGRWGFPNGVAGRGVCLCKPPSGHHHGRKRCNLGGSCGTARTRRGGASAVAGGGGLRVLALADSANRTALRTEHKVATGPRNKQLSTSHHLPTIISSNFSPIHSAIRFLRSASCQLGHHLNTFGVHAHCRAG